MPDIKPIETVYNGYRFRSRLEARWAVFFDAIGAEWEYEPEGYRLPDGTMYLPDFLLKNVRGRGAENIYVEVKGVLTKDDLHKIEMFTDPKQQGYPDGNHPIIIFGQIPDCRAIPAHYVPYLNRYVGPWWEIANVMAFQIVGEINPEHRDHYRVRALGALQRIRRERTV